MISSFQEGCPFCDTQTFPAHAQNDVRLEWDTVSEHNLKSVTLSSLGGHSSYVLCISYQVTSKL